MFQNLLDNAIEYSGDEPPRIDIAAERVGDRWRIIVADHGIGIDPDNHDRVFEVFQRLHTSNEYPEPASAWPSVNGSWNATTVRCGSSPSRTRSTFSFTLSES